MHVDLQAEPADSLAQVVEQVGLSAQGL